MEMERKVHMAGATSTRTMRFLLLVAVGASLVGYGLPLTFVVVLNLSPWYGLAGVAITAALSYGLLRSIGERLDQIELVLTRLNQDQPVVAPAVAQRDPLAPLMQQVQHLVAAHERLREMRGRLAEQISEAAAQAERKRLARDLHDSIKQQVFSMGISAAAAEAHLANDPAAARAALHDVRQCSQEAMVEMRALLQQLTPAPLEKAGLLDALRDQAAALSYRSGAQVETAFGALPDDQRFPVGAQERVFRIVQESLSNIARHARARTVRLSLHESADNSLELEISDDGQGFDLAAVERGMGLNNIERRIAELPGADVRLASTPGQGTRIHLTIPLQTDFEQEEVHRMMKQQLRNTSTAAIRNYYVFAFTSVLFVFTALNTTLAYAYAAFTSTWFEPTSPVGLSSSGLIAGGAAILAAISLSFAIWFHSRYRRQRNELTLQGEVAATAELRLHRHVLDANWMIWANILWSCLSLGLLPGWPTITPTLLPGWLVVILWAILSGLVLRSGWRRIGVQGRYLRALPDRERELELANVRSEMVAGWFMTILLLVFMIWGIDGFYFSLAWLTGWPTNFLATVLLLFISILTPQYWHYRRWRQKLKTDELEGNTI